MSLRVCDGASAFLISDILSISQVKATEQGVVLWDWFASPIFILEDWWAPHLHAQLLYSLRIVNGQQERLDTGFGAHCGQDGEVLRKNMSCTRSSENNVNMTTTWVSSWNWY